MINFPSFGSVENTLEGTVGDDILTGTSGADLIIGGDGRDRLKGGDGDDLLSAGTSASGALAEYLRGQDGNDTYVIDSQGGRVAILDETATGGDNDRVVFYDITIGDIQSTNYDAALDRMTLYFTNANGENVYTHIRNFSHVENFTFYQSLTLDQNDLLQHFGYDADMRLLAGAPDNEVLGDATDEILRGTNGDDLILGGDGRDRLVGGNGDDFLNAGANTTSDLYEFVRGHGGDDTYVVDKNSNNVAFLSETATSGTNDRVVFLDISIHDITASNYRADLDRLTLSFTNASGDTASVSIRDYSNFEGFSFSDVDTMSSDNVLAHFGYAGTAPLVDPTTLVDASIDGILYSDATGANAVLPTDMTLAAGVDNYSNGTPQGVQNAAYNFLNAATGQNFVFEHYNHMPEQDITSTIEGVFADGRYNTRHTSSGPDLMVLNDGDNAGPYIAETGVTNLLNLGSGSDIVFGMGGNDRLGGANGADAMYGGAGDDVVSGGNYGDVVFGGTGNDRLIGSSVADVMFGEEGDDHLSSGNGLSLMMGGDGNDILVSRSDSGEPKHVVGHTLDAPVIVLPEFEGAIANDDLYGGAGDDLFVFEFLIGAGNDADVLYGDRPDLYLANGKLNPDVISSLIDWNYVANLNGSRHEHWMDGIGVDVIHDFEVGSDTIGFIGHTVEVWDIAYLDLFNDGTVDTVITLRSNHMVHDMATGGMVEGSHHNDNLGTVVLSDVIVDDTLIRDNVIDIPVHGETKDIVLTGTAVLDNYAQDNYFFEFDMNGAQVFDANGDAAFRDAADVLTDFGTFTVLKGGNGESKAFDAYYAAVLKQLSILTNGLDSVDTPRASAIGTDASEVFYGETQGTMTIAGAGDDVILSATQTAVQLGREILFGGDGNDVIAGMTQDDIIYGGNGDDTILGGGVASSRVGDEDILFGGNGDDVLDGGVAGDWVFGGAGDDVIRSGSDLYVDIYNERTTLFAGLTHDVNTTTNNRDDRILTDHLVGGIGADTFEFSVLVAVKSGDSLNANNSVNPHTKPTEAFHATFGIDVVHDFTVGDDDLVINLTGSNLGTYTLDVTEIEVDTVQSAVINITSTRADDIYGLNNEGEVSGVEYDSTQSVGEILLIGVSAQEAETLLAQPGAVNYVTDIVSAEDYYQAMLPTMASDFYFG